MTTVAYRDGVLAGDTKVTEGETVVDDKQRKVYKLRDGCLYGFAGNLEDGLRLLRALRKDLDAHPSGLVEFSALLVYPDGEVGLYEGNTWVKQKGAYFAIGSGAVCALSAMDAGAGAVEAVKIGIKRDLRSGGRVMSVRLKK